MVGRRPNHAESAMIALIKRLGYKEGKYSKTYVRWNRRSLKRAEKETGNFYANCVWGPFKRHPDHKENGPYEMDIAFFDSKLDIEIDGINFHQTPEAIEKDRIRDKVLKHNGWKVVRITTDQVYVIFVPMITKMGQSINRRMDDE